MVLLWEMVLVMCCGDYDVCACRGGVWCSGGGCGVGSKLFNGVDDKPGDHIVVVMMVAWRCGDR